MDDADRGSAVARRGCWWAAEAFAAQCRLIVPLIKREGEGGYWRREQWWRATPALLGGCHSHQAAENAPLEPRSWNKNGCPCSSHWFSKNKDE